MHISDIPRWATIVIHCDNTSVPRVGEMGLLKKTHLKCGAYKQHLRKLFPGIFWHLRTSAEEIDRMPENELLSLFCLSLYCSG